MLFTIKSAAAVLTAIFGLSLAGCECCKEQPTTQPKSLAVMPAPRDSHITWQMDRFDTGIGDTNTQIGGGGDAD